MKKTKTHDKMVTLLTRGDKGVLQCVKGYYFGSVPACALEYLAKMALQLNSEGRFYPDDALDYYQAAYLELEKIAAKIDAGEKCPGDREAYMCGVARLVFQNLLRRGGKTRAEQRALLERGYNPNTFTLSSTDQVRLFDTHHSKRLQAKRDLIANMVKSLDKRSLRKVLLVYLHFGTIRKSAEAMGIPSTTFIRRIERVRKELWKNFREKFGK